MRPALVALALLLAFAPRLVGAKEVPAPDVVTEEGRALDEAVLAAGGPDFWGTVLVARGGEILLAKGYGLADYRERRNAPDTIHELASASKQVTATAILRLEQQRRLKTSDPLAKFFPQAPADKKAVTLDHLLHHTAGLSPDLGVPYAWQGSRDAYVRQVLGPPLVAVPGARFAYSNVGYALLAAVVEVAARQPFEDYVRKELFAKAGLSDTGFIGDERLARTGRASVRRADDARPDGTAVTWSWGWGYRGMGGVVTTALDVLAWDRALRGDAILGPEARRKLYAPALEGYAGGWIVESTDRETTKVSHSGGVRGYATMIARWLEEDVLVVVLSNGASSPHAVEAALAARLFAPTPVEADLDLTGRAPDARGILQVPDGLAWSVLGTKTHATLSLRDAVGTLATIRVPLGTARRLGRELGAAAAALPAPRPEEPAQVSAGVYLNQTGEPGPRVALREGLAVRVLPRYEGRDAQGGIVRDPRPVLLLALPGGWPLMVQMNPKATRSLADLLALP